MSSAQVCRRCSHRGTLRTRVAESLHVITDLAMATLDIPEINPEPLTGDLAVAGVYRTEEEAADHGLVVLAMGYSYWLSSGPDGVRLLIEPAAMDVARAHLAAYDRESIGWPPPPITDPWRPVRLDLFTPLLWAAAVSGPGNEVTSRATAGGTS